MHFFFWQKLVQPIVLLSSINISDNIIINRARLTQRFELFFIWFIISFELKYLLFSTSITVIYTVTRYA